MPQITQLNPKEIFNAIKTSTSNAKVDYYNPPDYFSGVGFKASDIINIDLNKNFGLIDPVTGELFKNIPGKYNHNTYLRRRSDIAEKPCSVERIKEKENKARKTFGSSAPYQSLALINGIPALLETNSPHMFNFWSRNWFVLGICVLGEEFGDYRKKLDYIEKNKLPFVRMINAIDPIFKERFEKESCKTGEQFVGEPKLKELIEVLYKESPDFEKPGAYYNPDTHTIVALNTDYYGQLKSWALGAVSDVGESLPYSMQFHSLHAAAAVVNGKAIAFVAPTGTGKSTQEAMLGTMNEWVPQLLESMTDPKLIQEAKSIRSQYHSDDWLYIDRKHIATISERHIYPRTNFVDDRIPENKMPALMKEARDGIFAKALKENVKVSPDKKFLLHDSIGMPNSRVIANPGDAVSNPASGLSFSAPLTAVNILLKFDDDSGIEAVNKEIKGAGFTDEDCKLPYTMETFFKEGECSFVVPLKGAKRAWEVFRFVPTKFGPGASGPEKWGQPTFEIVGTKYLAKPDKVLAYDKFQREFYESYGEKLNCSAINIGKPCWIGLGIKDAKNRDWNSLTTDEQELAIKGTAILMAKRAGAISKELAEVLIKILQKKAGAN
ncbi:MAG: hypothetical protein HY094_04510 [Candidatus Melainabacteria bacterium]|nr:hypothetical protein [Candidatus Melainabacteria bacterium]